MRDKTKFFITERQYLFIVANSAIGSGILSLSRATAKEAANDAWLAVLAGIWAPLISVILIEILCRRYPEITMVEIANKLFGKIIGRILSLFFFTFTLLLAASSIRIFTEITAMYVLPKTPKYIILAVFVIFIVYTMGGGSRCIGRFNELFFIALPIALLLMLPSMMIGHITNILPIGSTGIIGILKASVIPAYAYSGSELNMIYRPMIDKKKHTLRNTLIGISIIVFAYTFITFSNVFVFGYEPLLKITFPPIIMYKITDIPIIERLDLIFLIIWVAIVIKPSLNYLFATTFTIIKFLNKKPEKALSVISIAVGITVYIVALIPKTLNQTFELTTYLGYLYFIMGIIYPLMFLIVSLIRKGGKKEIEESA